MVTSVINGRIITPEGVKEGVLVIEDNKIREIGNVLPAGSDVIDAGGDM